MSRKFYISSLRTTKASPTIFRLRSAVIACAVAVGLVALSAPQLHSQTSPGYRLVAWSELGMHCMDGKDYSVFSVLPPYNTVKAQLFTTGTPPVPVTSGVTLTYEAVADATGSINTTSASKTNFWNYVRTLYLNSVQPNEGLTHNLVQSQTPHPLSFNFTAGQWEATAIPTVPYDDNGVSNAYPMAKIVARDSQGTILATASIVPAVSDEMTCKVCHASNQSAAAKPLSGWENNADPAKDPKLNILKKHDDRVTITAAMLSTLQANGYTYQSSLYATAQSGTPILCAACHSTNALSAAGVSGVPALTRSMHSVHASAVNPLSGTTLDAATTPMNSCYLCHPGKNTQCVRGAMHKTACYDCHGNLTKVATVTRRGWIDLPSCQMCHNNGQRFPTTMDSTGNFRTSTDTRFATNADVPVAGASLFRFSTGHGKVNCSGCHGSQHAEYPSVQPNDNVYSTQLQGHQGKIIECTTCHATNPNTTNGGPHGIHTVGGDRVLEHETTTAGQQSLCTPCHGVDYRGTPLSAVAAARTFNTGDYGTKVFAAGHQISCYDCHNGPHMD